jgi:iron complex outermembrane receptor protein
MNTRHRKFTYCVAVGLVLSTMQSATAQGVLEEIVVTAQKREQNIQDVGIAINAFSGDQMRDLGIERSWDIAAFSPGVHISGNLAGQNTQFSIRGVTQNDFNDIIEAPNAVYLDEGYFAVAQAQTFATFDVERVEILKGPQGTLFGRNATGGLVQYVSRKPSFDEVDGFAELTYGLFDSDSDAEHIRLETAIGGPLSENLAGRFAILYNEHDGYLNNLYVDPTDPFGAVGGGFIGVPGAGNDPGPGSGADMGDDETLAMRGTLLGQVGEDTTITFSVNYAETEVATGPYQSKPTIGVFDGVAGIGELINVVDVAPDETRFGIAADGSEFGSDADNDGLFGVNDPDGEASTALGVRLQPGADFFGYIDKDGDGWNTAGDFAFGNSGDTETTGVNLRIEHDINDSLLFTSVTDFKDYQKLLFIDVDSAPVNQLANYAGVDATSITQEFRLNGESDNSRWVLGFYYLNIDNMSDNGLKAPENSLPLFLDPLFSSIPAFAGGLDIGVQADLQTDSYSLFGQIERDLSDDVTLTAGLRVIQEEKDYFMRQGFFVSNDSRTVNVGDPLINIRTDFIGVPDFTADTSDTLWTGKLQLDWRPNDDLLLYAGINRGVKAGSFNAPIPGGIGFPDSTLPYDEEVLHSFEGGFKKTLASGRTRINGAVFYYDYSDYQAFLFTGVAGVVINRDAENYGVELELQTSPVDGLDAMLSFSWFDATVENVPLAINSPLPEIDVDPTYAPELQFAGLLRYEWPALGGMLHVTGDFSYSDEYFYNLRNFDADIYDSWLMVNAGIGWTNENGRWQVRFNVNNITDENAGIHGFDLATLCGCNEVSYQPPRWYGLSIRFSN